MLSLLLTPGRGSRRSFHGIHDVLVPRAAAEIPLNRIPDFRLVGVRDAVKELLAGHHHSRSAKAALETVFLPERLLYPVHLAGCRQTFDGRHRSPVSLHGKQAAGLHGGSVQLHRACAADRSLAAYMRTGKPEIIPKKVYEKQPRLDFSGARGAIYRDADSALH